MFLQLGVQEPSLHLGRAKWNFKVLLWLSAVLCAGLGAQSCRDAADGEEASAFYQGCLKSTSLPSPAPPRALCAVVFCACPVGHTSVVCSP